MLLGGEAAPAFVELLAPFGMRMEVVSTDQIGRAAAVKMFRSIVYKGLEALIFECVLGASHYGAEPRVFASLNESFPGIDFQKLADYMVGTRRGARRAARARNGRGRGDVAGVRRGADDGGGNRAPDGLGGGPGP